MRSSRHQTFSEADRTGLLYRVRYHCPPTSSMNIPSKSSQVKSSQVKASSNGGLLWCARRRERSGGRNWHGWMAPIPHVRLLLDHRGARSKSPISHQLRVGARVLTASSHCTIVLLETGTGTVDILASFPPVRGYRPPPGVFSPVQRHPRRHRGELGHTKTGTVSRVCPGPPGDV